MSVNDSEGLLTNLPVALIVMNQEMDVESATREALAMFGIRFHQDDYAACLEGISKALMSNPELIALIGASTLKLKHLGSRDHFRYGDGRRILDLTVFTMPPAGAMRYGVLLKDVTEQLQLERVRETTRNYLEQILDSLPLGIIVMDREMRITSVNRAQQDLFVLEGKDADLVHLVGMSSPDLFVEESQATWYSIQETVIQNGQLFLQANTTHIQRDGTPRVLSIAFSPLKNPEGFVTGAVRICEDITSRVKLEEKAREAELMAARLETLQQITVTLNHEINNALTSIMTGIGILTHIGEPIPENKRPTLDNMMSQTERIAAFLEQLQHLKEIKTVSYLGNSDEQMLKVDGVK